jgi:hypothetical protein
MSDLERQSRILLWVARVGGVIVSISWIGFLSTAGIKGYQSGEAIFTIKGILLAILIITSSIGVGIAWKNPDLGGKVTIISSLFLCILAYFSTETNRFFAVTISGIPFFLVGLLFLQSQAETKETS